MTLKRALLMSIVALVAYAPFAHAAQTPPVQQLTSPPTVQRTLPALQQRQDCTAFGTLTGVENEMEEMFVVMMAYLKMVQKEAREDAKLARQDAKTELTLKSAKIAQDNKSIDAQKREAQQKADTAMSAATNSLVMGVAQGLIQISGSPAAKGSTNAQDLQRFTATANGLKSDIARLRTEIVRNEALVKEGKSGAMSAADVERMKTQLDKGLQDVRNAKRSAKAC